MIRQAQPDDAEAMGEIAVEAWRATYVGMMPQHSLDALSAADRGAFWRDRLSDPTPGSHVAVAESGGRVQGFVAYGSAAPAEDGEADAGEVFSLNVRPAEAGHGIGGALLAYAEHALLRQGHAGAVLRVARDNDRARRFYERRGWTSEGRSTTAEVFGVAVSVVTYAKHWHARPGDRGGRTPAVPGS